MDRIDPAGPAETDVKNPEAYEKAEHHRGLAKRAGRRVTCAQLPVPLSSLSLVISISSKYGYGLPLARHSALR